MRTESGVVLSVKGFFDDSGTMITGGFMSGDLGVGLPGPFFLLSSDGFVKYFARAFISSLPPLFVNKDSILGAACLMAERVVAASRYASLTFSLLEFHFKWVASSASTKKEERAGSDTSVRALAF